MDDSWQSVLAEWIELGDKPLPSARLALGDRHLAVAKRMSETLVNDTTATYVIVGERGSGKSTIANLLRTEIEAISSKYLYVHHSAWPYSDSSSLVQGILDCMIAEIENAASTLALRHIPAQYISIISEIPSVGSFFGSIAGLCGERPSPARIVSQIDDILLSVDRYLVVWIDDLERFSNEWSESKEHSASSGGPLGALLSYFKESRRIRFVLAVSANLSNVTTQRVTKLGTHHERIDRLHSQEVADLLRSFMKYQWEWSETKHNDILPALDHSIFSKEHGQIEAFVELARNPRILRHALTRMHFAWRRLHGEIHPDHLMGLSIVRESDESLRNEGEPSNESAFQALIDYWENIVTGQPARREMEDPIWNELSSIRKDVVHKKKPPIAHAIKTLLKESTFNSNWETAQYLRSQNGLYFQRAITEDPQCDATDGAQYVRDQEVLAAYEALNDDLLKDFTEQTKAKVVQWLFVRGQSREVSHRFKARLTNALRATIVLDVLGKYIADSCDGILVKAMSEFLRDEKNGNEASIADLLDGILSQALAKDIGVAAEINQRMLEGLRPEGHADEAQATRARAVFRRAFESFWRGPFDIVARSMSTLDYGAASNLSQALGIDADMQRGALSWMMTVGRAESSTMLDRALGIWFVFLFHSTLSFRVNERSTQQSAVTWMFYPEQVGVLRFISGLSESLYSDDEFIKKLKKTKYLAESELKSLVR